MEKNVVLVPVKVRQKANMNIILKTVASFMFNSLVDINAFF